MTNKQQGSYHGPSLIVDVYVGDAHTGSYEYWGHPDAFPPYYPTPWDNPIRLVPRPHPSWRRECQTI